MSRQHTSIASAARDLANYALQADAFETAKNCGYRAGSHKLEDLISRREEDMTAEFVTLAKLLGFSVFKADASMAAAE